MVKPEAIQPTANDPSDFDAFWQVGKAELAKLPIEAKGHNTTPEQTGRVNRWPETFLKEGRGHDLPGSFETRRSR